MKTPCSSFRLKNKKMKPKSCSCSCTENVETGEDARKHAIFGTGILKYIEHENGEADAADLPVSTFECRTIAGFRL